jgi:hypothetical protein
MHEQGVGHEKLLSGEERASGQMQDYIDKAKRLSDDMGESENQGYGESEGSFSRMSYEGGRGFTRGSTKKEILSSKEFDINNLMSYQESLDDVNNFLRKTEMNPNNYLLASIDKNYVTTGENEKLTIHPNKVEKNQVFQKIPNHFVSQTYSSNRDQNQKYNQFKPKNYSQMNPNFTERFSVQDSAKAQFSNKKKKKDPANVWRKKTVPTRAISTSVEKTKAMFERKSPNKSKVHREKEPTSSIRRKMNQVEVTMRKSKYQGSAKNSGLKKFVSKNNMKNKKKTLVIKKLVNSKQKRERSADVQQLKFSLTKPFKKFKQSADKLIHQRFASYEKKCDIFRGTIQRNLKQIGDVQNQRNNSLSDKLKKQQEIFSNLRKRKNKWKIKKKPKNQKATSRDPMKHQEQERETVFKTNQKSLTYHEGFPSITNRETVQSQTQKFPFNLRKQKKIAKVSTQTSRANSKWRESSLSKDKFDRFKLSSLLVKQKNQKFKRKEGEKMPNKKSKFLQMRAGSPLARKLMLHKKNCK